MTFRSLLVWLLIWCSVLSPVQAANLLKMGQIQAWGENHRCHYPINASDPDGLDFRVRGSAGAARSLLYQLESISGLNLSYGADRRLRIDGGRISTNAASRYLAFLVSDPTSTTVRALSDNETTNYFPGTGSFFTKDGTQAVKPSRIDDLALLDRGIAAGALFHEIAEAYSRSAAGNVGKSQDHNDPEARARYNVHHAYATGVERAVLGNYGWGHPDSETQVYTRGDKSYEVTARIGGRYRPSSHWHVDFSFR